MAAASRGRLRPLTAACDLRDMLDTLAPQARLKNPGVGAQLAALGYRPAAQLVGISAISLFIEMALIRFINATVQVIAYFNNVVILATFLGLGFGALCARRWPRLFAHAPWLLVVFVTGLVLLDRFTTALEDHPDLVAWTQGSAAAPLNLPSGVVVTSVFCACFGVFVPFGCRLGQALNAFDDRLQAYGYDLLGSIAGVVAFCVVSWGRYPPWAWFAVACSGIAILFWADGTSLKWRAPLLLGVVAISLLASDGYYSPYYRIHVNAYGRLGSTKPIYYSIFVDKLRIQDAIDFDQDLTHSEIGAWVPYYQLPYKIKPKPARVLVLGGGSGNDTAIALKAGAQRVDTVEIDPILVEFGHELHPQRPYADPRVHTFNDDARAFLRRNTEPYDLIVMNALDSHHQLPGLSTLRLESFIYTVQAFQDVKRHMTANSVFVVHLSSTRPWMGERLFWSLTRAFGREPALFSTPDSPFRSVAFVYGPDSVIQAARSPTSGLVWGPGKRMHAARSRTVLATDDWPHLYLADAHIPAIYYRVLGFMVLMSAFGFGILGRARPGWSALHFTLLGASFMLLETRAITQFALLFGSTWLVSAIVVGSILGVIYCGNRLLQTRSSLPKAAVYLSLLGSLLALYFLQLDALLPLSFGLRVIAAALVIGTPVFAASLLFSDSFRRAPDASAAFGANLLGVALGGTLEYSSMQFGLRFLYVIAAAMYLLAWLAERLPRTARAVSA